MTASARVARAAELQVRASDLNTRGRPLGAARTARAALSRLGLSVGRGIDWNEMQPSARGIALAALITLAVAESELRGLDIGLRTLRIAAAGIDACEASDLRARLINQHAVLLLRAGRDAEALAKLDEADPWLNAAEPIVRCHVLINRSYLLLGRAQLRRARSDLQTCLELTRVLDAPVLANKALHNLGYVEYLSGNLARALQLMDEAAEQVSDVIDGVGLLDKARVLMEAGLVREAEQVLADAGGALAADRLMQDVGETEIARAECALIISDVTTARRLATRARDRFRRRGNDRLRRNADLVLLQADLASGRPGARLFPVALRLCEDFTRDGLMQQAKAARLVAVEALLAGGETAQAAAMVSGLARRKAADPVSLRLHAAYLAARVDLGRGRRSSARQRVERGLDDLVQYQATFGSIDLRTASAVHGRRLADLGIAIAINSGDPERIFGASEIGRFASNRILPVRASHDEETAESLAELRHVIDNLAAASTDRDATRRLTERRVRLERSIAERRWGIEGPRVSQAPVTPDAVAEVLRATGATMLMFVIAEDTLHVVRADSATIKVLEIGPARPIEEAVRRVHADLDVLAQPQLASGLRDAVTNTLRRSLKELDALLLGRSRIGSEPVVIVSTGSLVQLCWSNLPSLRGVPTVVAPSATAWYNAQHRHSGATQTRGVAVLAGPGLPRASDELDGIRDAWSRADPLCIEGATRADVIKMLAERSLVHIAAHGAHHTGSPLFSSLQLSDGSLFAHELDLSARVPAHIVLSACELGRSTVRSGDEALGLTSVLLRLGASSVLSGVARVGDGVAAEAMIDYHARLVGGADAAESLAATIADADAFVPFVCFGATARPALAGPGDDRQAPQD